MTLGTRRLNGGCPSELRVSLVWLPTYGSTSKDKVAWPPEVLQVQKQVPPCGFALSL